MRRTRFRRSALIAGVTLTLLAALLLSQIGRAQNQGGPIPAKSETIEKSIKAYSGINVYDAEVWIQERIQGKLHNEERVHSVFVKSPLKMYFHWLPGGAFEGLQVSYVAERDGPNKYYALETGFRGLIGLQKYSFDNLLIKQLYPHFYPLKQYHLGFLINRLEANYRRAAELGKISITAEGLKETLIPGRRLRVFKCTFPPDFPLDSMDGFRVGQSIVGYDEETSLPLFIENYNSEGQLHSRFKYMKFSPNPAIDASMFELKR